MRDFQRCQKRSLLADKAKSKTKTPPKVQKLGSTSGEARNLEDILRH